MMTSNLSARCGACCRWVTNGFICKDCAFHTNCASSSLSFTDNTTPWDCNNVGIRSTLGINMREWGIWNRN